jgi:hypothetical protein
MFGNRVATVGGGYESGFAPKKEQHPMTFRILGLPAEEFVRLFDLSGFDLAATPSDAVQAKVAEMLSAADDA